LTIKYQDDVTAEPARKTKPCPGCGFPLRPYPGRDGVVIGWVHVSVADFLECPRYGL